MTEPLQDGIQQESIGDNGQNPAWGPFLEQIPSQFHDQVIPALKDWDGNVQKQFQQIHSQYEPYKGFIERQIKPDHIETALGFVNAIESNPKEVIEALQTYYNLTPQQATQATQAVQQQQQQNNGSIDFSDLDPRIASRFTAIEQQNELMAKILVDKNNQETQAQEDARLDAEMKQMHEEYMQKNNGRDFNEKVVMGLALGGNISLKDAVAAYDETIQGMVKQYQRPAPQVLGGGGFIPSNKVSTRQMSENELSKFVANYLNSAAQDST